MTQETRQCSFVDYQPLARLVSQEVTVSFFAIEIIHCVRTDNSSLRYRYTPLIAVGLIVCISNWIVRHDVKDHVCCSVINDLVWLTRLENERVASLNRSGPLFVADNAAA